MNLENIVNIININHDGIIVNIEKENNFLNIDIEIAYLTKYINEEYTLFRYKIIEYKEIELIDCDNNIYNDINEIKNMKLNIIEAKIGNDNNIVIGVWAHKKVPYGKLYLWANDIKIYDQNYCEMEYNKLDEICKKYWDDWQKYWDNKRT
jgi:hypothetical protein